MSLKISYLIPLIKDSLCFRCAIIETVYNGKGHEYRIGDIIDQVSQRNKRCLVNTVLSVNNKLGFINQDEQFEDRTVASEDTSNYKGSFLKTISHTTLQEST